jgi:hypothetical protein
MKKIIKKMIFNMPEHLGQRGKTIWTVIMEKNGKRRYIGYFNYSSARGYYQLANFDSLFFNDSFQKYCDEELKDFKFN